MSEPRFPRLGVSTWFVLGVIGCVDMPARFADKPPVAIVDDEKPIVMPARSTVPDVVRYSQIFAEHVVVSALDPQRTPPPRDVNAFDEVPTSSWIAKPSSTDEFAIDGPPALPIDEGAAKGERRSAVDARGLAWEIVHDAVGPRVAAGVVASRLFHRLGYSVSESYAVRLPSGERVLATRYPAARSARAREGVTDLGPTAQLGTRFDDANDGIEHQERRSLRALGLVAAWLGIDEIRPRMLRDVYVGRSGRGFVEHEVVSLDDALGAGLLARAKDTSDPDRPPKNGWVALGSLGFGPKEEPDPATTPGPGLGLFFPEIDIEHTSLAVPFPPAEDALAPDRYWIAKRMAQIGDADIARAVSAADLDRASARTLETCLTKRRDAAVRFAFEGVTPLEVASVVSRNDRIVVELDDTAIRRGFARAVSSHYVVEIVDERDRPLAPPTVVSPDASTVRVAFGTATLERAGYVVVRIVGRRGEAALPRSFEVHLRASTEGPVVRGIVH